jgi:DNA-directed RNA polymerase subunit E'/Rpb7
MKVVSPYRNIKQNTRISVEPYHMNSDIKNNMKNILKKKVENKCNTRGYIDEVYKILEYSDGFMPPENLNSCAIYNITYHCRICIPIENSIIVGIVKIVNMELIIVMNGPIIIFIPKENIDNNVWDNTEGYLHKTQKNKLSVNNYVKVQIIDKRINLNDTQIKSMGRLLDFATSDEVEKYYNVKIQNDKTNSSKLNADYDLIEENTENTDTNESNFIL